MGRRPDAPADQAAKGYPGKRKTKAERRAEEVARLASLLASAPAEDSGVLSPPAFLALEACAPALAIWRRYAPHLSKLNLLHPLDRDTFALFCAYVAEFYQAAEIVSDPSKKWHKVKTVSGDEMWREHPAVARMDEARKAMLDIAKRFGLTALDRIDLLAKQRGGGLGQAPESNPELPLAGGSVQLDPEDPIGLLARFDSPPPSRRN
jgi:P27 family predicted phage terminase small subunit